MKTLLTLCGALFCAGLLAPSSKLQAANGDVILTIEGTPLNTWQKFPLSPNTILSVNSGGAVTPVNTISLSNGGTGASSASGARTALGLVIGTDVLAPAGNGSALTALNASNIASGSLSLGRIAQGGATANQVLQWSGSAWAPATIAAGGISDGDKGSITVSGSGATWTIDTGAVSDGMLAGSISPSKITDTAAVLTANTFTGQQTMNAASATGALNVVPTWNNAGTAFAGIYMRATNTASSASSSLMDLGTGTTSLFRVGVDASLNFSGVLLFQPNFGGSGRAKLCGTNGFFFNPNTEFTAGASASLGWVSSATGAGNVAQDTALRRVSAGVMGLRNPTGNTGAALYAEEMTAPSAPSANGVVIYAEDNGAGKTRLMVRFATGAAQQLSIEP